MNCKGPQQFELWEECNSKCSFCYLGNLNIKTPDEQKLKNLVRTIEIISNKTLYQKIDCLGYIGGEFFQGQLVNEKVKAKFKELMQKNDELLSEGYISSMWLSASLLIGDQQDLFDVLHLFRDSNIPKIWILTSYDTIGRFHSKKELEHWKDCIAKLKQEFPQINVNITTIVTGDFIQKYLDNQLQDLNQVVKEYNCSLFLKPTCDINDSEVNESRQRSFNDIDRIDIQTKESINKKIPNFFPTRANMLKFLTRYRMDETEFAYDKLFNPQYRAEYLQLFGHRYSKSHRIQDKYQEEFTSPDNVSSSIPIESCDHGSQYRSYVDCDKCLICDKMRIRGIVS